MRMACNGLIPTEEWEHKADLQNKYGDTVAMMLAEMGINPP